jgi:UDP-2,4-diacetamido-2,4,6-trideoxy-beta-L-altropyranose hydrolase/UDP-4-amino-4,6-dideoxy-N-acetyl-beta-L-altrosamine N-acetyltransferase
MRCVTLADGLSRLGYGVRFVCKDHPSNLISYLRNRGYIVYVIPICNETKSDDLLKHSGWLGGTQDDDAQKTMEAVKSLEIEWMIIDHYSIDERWHQKVRKIAKRILVIDDLADRKHDCDLLLDQNPGAAKELYRDLVPENCTLLLGPKYALLRPEFAKWRGVSLERRRNSSFVQNVIVSFGGVDLNNATSEVLNALQELPSLARAEVHVLLGSQSPHRSSVEAAAELCSNKVILHQNTSCTAKLLSDADFAIGASGSSAYERCVLGVPTITYVIADNQIRVATVLENLGATILINSISDLPDAVRTLEGSLLEYSHNSAFVLDGEGLPRTLNSILPTSFSIMTHGVELLATSFPEISNEEIIESLRSRNHPYVRAKSLNNDPISLKDHVKFVENLSSDLSRRYYHVSQYGQFVGVITFNDIDWIRGSASFGVYANLFKKVSQAGEKLMTVADSVIVGLGLVRIHLVVGVWNTKAIRLYKKFGYGEVGRKAINGSVYMTYVRRYT